MFDASGAVAQTLMLSTNQVGSVQLVTDASTGEVVQRLEYDEFGRVFTDSAPGMQPFGFAGGLYDSATNLVRFGARDYDADVGRWVARDPVRFGGAQLNVFSYLSSLPTVGYDPSGLTRWDKLYGLPKKFWKWYHRQHKKTGDPDLDEHEAKDLCDEWRQNGQPGPDNKRGRKRTNEDDDDFPWNDILEIVIPFPDLVVPDFCGLDPMFCGGPTA